MPIFSAGSASVSIVPDFTQADADIRAWFARQGDLTVQVKPNLDQNSLNAIRAQLAGLNATVGIDPTLDSTKLDAIRAQLAGLNAKVGISPDLNNAELALLQARLDNLHGTANISVDKNALASSISQGFQDAMKLSGLDKLSAVATAAIAPAAIATAAGALTELGAAASAAIGAVALVPAGLLALAAPLAVVKLGTENMGAAFKLFSAQTPAQVKAAQDALDKLAPSAREVVLAVGALQPAFHDLQLSVQQQLFAGVGTEITNLGHVALPIMKVGLDGVAASLNSGLVASMRALTTDGAAFTTIFANINTAGHILAGTMAPLVQAFVQMATVGSQFLPQIAAGFSKAALAAADWVQKASASGQLVVIIQNAINVLVELGKLLINLGSIIAGVFQAALPFGNLLLKQLVDLTGGLATFVHSADGQTALKDFFSSVNQVAAALLPAIQVLVQTIVISVLPVIGQLAAALAPVIAQLAIQLAAAVRLVAPLFIPLAQVVAALVSALAPLIPQLGQIINTLLPPLTKILGELAPVLGQITSIVATVLLKAAQALAPAIGPVGDAFIRVLQAVVPLIPVLTNLAIQLLPPLLAIVVALVPVLAGTAEAFAKIVTAVVGGGLAPVLVTIANVLAAVLVPILGVMADHINLVVAAIVIWKTVSIAMAVVNAVQMAGGISALIVQLAIWIGSLGVVRIATEAWTAVQWLLNLALDANPIGIVIVAVGALIAIVVLLATHWTTVVSALTTGGKAVVDFFTGPFLSFFTQTLPAAWNAVWSAALSVFVSTWNTISSTATTVWNAMASFFGTVWNGVRTVWSTVWTAAQATFATEWSTIQSVATTVWNAIASFFGTVWNGVRTTWTTIWAAVQAAFTAAWSAIQSTATTVWNAIASFFGTIWGGARTTWSTVWAAVQATFTTVWSAIQSTATTVWSAIVSFFGTIWGGIRTTWTTIWAAVQATFTTVWSAIQAAATAVWNAIANFFTSAWASFSTGWRTFWTGVQTIFTTIWNLISSTAQSIWGAIQAFFNAAWGAYTAAWQAFWNAASAFFTTTWNAIRSAAQSIWGAIQAFFNAAWGAFTAAWQAFWNAASAFFTTTWNAIHATAQSIWGAIQSFFNAAWAAFTSAWQAFWNAASAFFTTTWNAIQATALRIWNAIQAFFNAAWAAFTAAWQAFWNAASAFFTTTWNTIQATAQRIWNAIQAFFNAAWAAFTAAWQAFWNAASAFFTAIWTAIQATAQRIWTALQAFWNAAWAAFTAAWQAFWNAASTFFTAIWTAIQATAQRIWSAIQAFFNAAWNAFTAAWQAFWNAASAFFTNIWNTIQNTARTVWTAIASFFTGAWAAFTGAWNAVWNSISATFTNVWNGIKAFAVQVWNDIKAAIATPINFVIGTVLNNGLFKAWDAVNDFLGLPFHINPLPTIPGFATGGYTGDYGMFGTGGTEDPAGVVHAKEFVFTANQVANAGGPDAMYAMANQLDGGYTNGGYVKLIPGYAGGGYTYPAMEQWVLANIPGAIITSDLRPGAADYHGLGEAVDFSFGGNPQSLLMPAAAKVAASWHGITELIHNPNESIKNGAVVPASFWGAPTWAAHANHVHWAMTPAALAGGGGGGPGGVAGAAPTSVSILGQIISSAGDILSLLTNSITGPVGQLIGQFKNSPWAQILAALPKKLISGLWDKASGSIGTILGSLLSAPPPSIPGLPNGAVAAGTVQAIVQNAAATHGWGTGPEWAALSNVINRESSWNPNAQNPTSTAFGLFQFLDSTWATVGSRKTSDPASQAIAGMNYIQQRYGDPIAAWNHELAFHWFDGGGWLPPGSSTVYNGTGGNELVLNPGQQDRLAQMLGVGAVPGGNTSTTQMPVWHFYLGDTEITDLVDARVAYRSDHEARLIRSGM